ncbi:MAG: HK97 gp10 family phage protein [Sphingomonas phyllosphaerae]|uniref:HK97 gp10 family phage protein n=1 Tax=Sphingomonas phyllosphaerae TaxID=257003 RepID=UPI002FFBA007
MTVAVTGLDDVQRYIRNAPDRIKRILRGAGHAGGRVIVAEAKAEAPADETRENIFKTVEILDDHIRVTIDVKPGWGRSLAIWAEYGTVGHYISVDAKQSGGRTTRRVNTLAKTGTLVINGKPVGATVWHPGARQAPFLRPAVHLKLAEATRAAQAYIDEQIRNGAIAGGSVAGDDE